MSDALYRNAAGQEVTHASYSARLDFKKCPRYFQLTRVDGWRDKTERAAPLFGKCVEAGIQFFEESKRAPGTGAAMFTDLWNKVKTTENFDKLVYTACEGDWDSLLRAGQEMARLYEIKVPGLPIVNPIFQQTVKKQLFPGSNLAALTNKAVFDVLSFPAWDHPALPKIPMMLGSNVPRSLIVDIKTSGVALDRDLVGLDPQLAEYAWMSRIPDVAFLWFVKHGHSLKKASRVTLLYDLDTPPLAPAKFRAGNELHVLRIGDKEDESRVYLSNITVLHAYEAALNGLRGKAREAVEADFIRCWQEQGDVVTCKPSDLTKQQMQFAAVRLTDEQMDETGRAVAQTTVEMNRAHQEEYYPKTGAGIRFPNNQCCFCAMRWICLGNSEQRDLNLKRRGDEWLDDFADSDGE